MRDPPRAEAMTLRLASVFRHVLAHSSRSMTTVRDEMEFLRTYLYIEEARFGDRLRVEHRCRAGGRRPTDSLADPAAAGGECHEARLGPKPGPGNIWISAAMEEHHVRVKIEDDGMGLPTAAATGEGSRADAMWPSACARCIGDRRHREARTARRRRRARDACAFPQAESGMMRA